MRKITLGASDLSVSQMCLGTMYFGTKTSIADSHDILNYFHNGGGNFIDTSNNYAFWMDNGLGNESEITIGKWILDCGKRDSIILATKCGARPTYFDGDMSNVRLEGLSYSTILKAVDQSLSRLNTEYIDVLYGHIDFIEYPIEERLKAFDELIKSGKVKSIGTSNSYAWRLEESRSYCQLHQLTQYSCIQQKYSYLRPKYNADFGYKNLSMTN